MELEMTAKENLLQLRTTLRVTYTTYFLVYFDYLKQPNLVLAIEFK